MKLQDFFIWFAIMPLTGLVAGTNLEITSADRSGRLGFAGSLTNSVVILERAARLDGTWSERRVLFATNVAGQVEIPAPLDGFYRLSALDIPATSEGFTNLATVYSTITTIAGNGQHCVDGLNGWKPDAEGGLATQAELSRPHFAMADMADNVYIADKDGQAVRKLSPDGKIHTVAGTNQAGDDGDSPMPATSGRLSYPNGLWVRADGTLYVLDSGNSKIRRIDTNGIMRTFFTVTNRIVNGRGLWVKDDESLAYVASGTNVLKWTPSQGVKTYAKGFKELGNIVVGHDGHLVVTDRGRNRAYRLVGTGPAQLLAGNGKTTGGGDGLQATNAALAGVRAVWPVPTGGYLLGTHAGSQIWYVDAAGIAHLFVDGAPTIHAGDGGAYTPGKKVSEIRSVTIDYHGNLLITENDCGFVRKIRFGHLSP